jgi:hypothetical protein
MNLIVESCKILLILNTMDKWARKLNDETAQFEQVEQYWLFRHNRPLANPQPL